ncbi:MAG TPA: EAL domain-containing protein [Polyangiaceae bacterium]|nr:EAL domain-containing protein [Polyangiaceae bacterium]
MTSEFPPASVEPSTVLIVDDDVTCVRGLARYLAERKYRVETCVSAVAAVERVKRGGVQVIVSDITMPGMTGVELLRAIRVHEPDLPVVLMTGLPAVESAAEAVEYGAFKYIVKPVEPAVVQKTVDRAVHVYRLARAKREALALIGVPEGASDRAGLEACFERALASLWMAFQPIVRASDRSVFGYEALLRSEEPALRGPLPVLSAAERLGQLGRLGRLVRSKAALPLSSTPGEPVLFVNLHPLDLVDPEIAAPDSALAAVAERVVLEITERAALQSLENVRAKVGRLREIGFRIAVDDLGAGYAGLSSFALLEPDIVKLDMTLVRDVDRHPVKQKLVASMANLCKDMGLLTVAEGVETESERETLVELGCDLLQGFLFAHPGPAFPEVQLDGARHG